MKTLLCLIISVLPLLCCCSNEDKEVSMPPFTLPQKAIVLAEQATKSILIFDAESKKTVWTWNTSKSDVPPERLTWFSNPSEVKPVYNNRYILMTASGGAVALLRIADSKLMYYANAGQNPHSAELLPDGNIVAVSSDEGKLSTFITDTISGFGKVHASYNLPSAHNVVWDKSHKKLFATEGNHIYTFDYNSNRQDPLLLNKTKLLDIPASETCGHDLFPVYGEKDILWLTTNENVWKYNIATNQLTKIYPLEAVKSVCNSPNGVLMLYPTFSWWSDGLINEVGKKQISIYGAKIYKGRWMIDNTFSYPEKHDLKLE